VLTCQVGGRVLLHVRQVWHLRSDKLVTLGSRNAAFASPASGQPRHCLSLLEIAMLLRQLQIRQAVSPGRQYGASPGEHAGQDQRPLARGD